MTQPLNFAMVFTGNASDLKAATADVRKELDSVGNEADQSSASLNKHAGALDRDADAAKKAAQAQRDLAKAEKDVRDEVARATGKEAAQSTAAIDKHAASLDRDAAAAKKAAQAQLELAAAEKKVREEIDRATGATPRPPTPPAGAAPTAPSSPARPAPGAPPASPPVPAANDNATRFRRQNSAYQLFDIGQGLAGGMPLGMIAGQQGPQLLQNYMGQGGGAKAALEDFKALGTGVLKLVTPVTASFAAVASAAAIAAVAYGSYLKSTKEVETAATGLGRAVAGSSEDMEAAAQAGASAAGISVSAARSMEAQFLHTGKIGSDNFEKLIGLSKDFAATFGLSTSDAGDQLAEMFSDPGKAAEQLYRQYGLIDAATTRQVQNLVAQNRAQEAQGMLIDALPAKLANAEKAATGLGRVWRGVINAGSTAFETIGKGVDTLIDGPSADEQIDRLQKRIASRQAAAGQGGFSRVLDKERAELAALQAQKSTSEKAQREAAEVERGKLPLSIADQSPVAARDRQRRDLENQIDALQSGVGNKSYSPDEAKAVNDTLAAKKVVLDALVNSQRRLAEIDRIDVQLQAERNPLTRANLSARKAELELATQELGPSERANEIAKARNKVISEAIGASSAQAGSMREEADVRKQLAVQIAAGTLTSADAQAKLAEELALRPMIAAAANAEQADKEKLTKSVNETRDAYRALTDQQKEWASLDLKRSQDERLAGLELEKRLIGATTAEREKALAMAEAERSIKTLGLTGQAATDARHRAGRIAGASNDNNRAKAGYDAETDKRLDGYDNRISAARDPVTRANLEAERERERLVRSGADADTAAAAAARVRARALTEATTGVKTQIADLSDEMAVRRQLDAQVAAGTLSSQDANRVLQQELQLRPLIAAASKLEGNEKQKLLKDIADLRAGYATLDQAEKQSQAREMLRAGSDDIAKLRVEQQLIGQNETVRSRTLALLEAEQRIRDLGVGSTSAIANQIRAQAEEQANLTSEVEKTAAAWEKVQSTAEGAIDKAVDAFDKGDFKGVIKDIADDIKKMSLDMAVKAPLKNALLGTDLPTIADAGGIGGIFKKLFGGEKAKDPASIVASAMGQSVGAMTVTAATVVVNGAIGAGGSLASSLIAGANDNKIGATAVAGAGAGGRAAGAVDLGMGLLGANETKQTGAINSFLKQGGVDIDAARTAWCAGFVNSALEQVGIKGSGSNLANSFQSWGKAIDPSAILRGDVLLNSRGLGADQAGGHVGLATGQTRMGDNGLQVQMLSGNSGNAVQSTWVDAMTTQARRATEAGAALSSVGDASGVAVQGLDGLGNVLGKAGSALSSTGPGAGGASSGGGFFSWLSSLFGGGSSSFKPTTTLGNFLTGKPGFAKGTEGAPEGWAWVGEDGPELMRMRGGEVVRNHAVSVAMSKSAAPGYQPQNIAASAPGMSVVVHNYSGQEVQQEETTDARGNRQATIVIGQQGAAAVTQRGNPMRKSIQDEFGLKPKRIAR